LGDIGWENSIKRDCKEIGFDWNYLTVYRLRWLVVANTVMDLQVLKRRRIPRLDEKLLVTREGLCFMNLVSLCEW